MSVSTVFPPDSPTVARTVAFGPEFPGAGSWEWVGTDLAAELNRSDIVRAVTFHDFVPECDACVFVKWLPELETLRALSQRTVVLFCPIDIYGGGHEIDFDWRRLRLCDRVVLHTPYLEKYVRGYAETALLDHHWKYAVARRTQFVEDGPLLWTGVWLNLPPLVQWANAHGLPGELVVLTNFGGHALRAPADFGFDPRLRVRMEEWSPARHLELLPSVRGVIDVKGDDFRQRHKPASKAVDAIVSGIPLAANADSSVARWLWEFGFEVASPDDTDRWLSRAYWEQTCELGDRLREALSREAVAVRLNAIVDDVLRERGAA